MPQLKKYYDNNHGSQTIVSLLKVLTPPCFKSHQEVKIGVVIFKYKQLKLLHL
jgi:hypothetical protein